MTRHNTLPTPLSVSRLDQHHYQFEIFISPELIYFPGHFPIQSILPGVVVIDWCMGFAEQYLGIRPEFDSMEVIKFKKLITPNMIIQLNIQYQADKNKILFSVHSEQGEHNSGKITLKKSFLGQES